ncbi:hypothetical protein TNCV_1255381 [Trichonephila clavipes]|nr:hypothetical protein TNCV_1255381 [Trichonephila clavipes]
MNHEILNHSQVKRMVPELTPYSPNFDPSPKHAVEVARQPHLKVKRKELRLLKKEYRSLWCNHSSEESWMIPAKGVAGTAAPGRRTPECEH